VLRRLFEEMDVNHDGRVTMQELVDGKCFSMLDRLPNVDLACKEALKAALLHAMRPQGGHAKHARLDREACRWMLSGSDNIQPTTLFGHGLSPYPVFS